jgi:PKD repeat protein
MKIKPYFLSLAALFLVLAAAPGLAYWPPLQATTGPTVAISGANRVVNFSVHNPATGADIGYTYIAGPSATTTVDGTGGAHGLLYWRVRDTSTGPARYRLVMAVYDPGLGWQVKEGAWHAQQVTVRGCHSGVVLYEHYNGTNSYGEYAWTYLPGSGTWRDASWLFPKPPAYFAVYDGVVAFKGQPDVESVQYKIYCAIYDHLVAGAWVGYESQYYQAFLDYLGISNGTVNYTVNGAHKVGYDCTAVTWFEGLDTRLRAGFLARPTSGEPPLTVWFTDLSQGAKTIDPQQWRMDYSDSSFDTWRSGYHIFNGFQRYDVTQTVTGPTGATHSDTQEDLIVTDSTPPTNCSLSINNGATYATSTNVALYVSATDNSGTVTEMQFANDGQPWSSWEPYAAVRPNLWSLPAGNGVKKVNARFRDLAGNVSATVSDTIILDTTLPTGSININNGTAATNSTKVTLNLTSGDTGSGLKEMSFSNDGVNFSDPEAIAATKSWFLTAGDGDKTVYVKFTDNAGNSSVFSDTITLDTTPPGGTFNINGGALYANDPAVTLNLTGITGSPAQMRFSNNNSTWSSWVAYANSYGWNLSAGDGLKTVYGQFKDALGNTSAKTDTITLDTVQPTGTIVINNGAPATNNIQVTLTLTASDTGSGLDSMSFSNDGATFTEPEAIASTKDWDLAPGGDGLRTVYAKYMDKAGNYRTVSDTITLDTIAPTGTVAINGGAEYTNTVEVTINLDVPGASHMRFNNRFDDNWSAWFDYAATKPWTLLSGDGPKSVFAQFKDEAGNTSSVTGDDIILDSTPPADGVLTAAPGVNQIVLSWSGFTDAGSGLKTYELYYSNAGIPDKTTGTKVYEGNADNFTHNNLDLKANHYYRLYAVDNADNYSAGATAKVESQKKDSGFILLLLLDEPAPAPQ